MEQVYFSSDHHYGHKNIIDFCKRPFKNTDEMCETLIENHNKVVKPEDRFYVLGDMFWRTVSDGEAFGILQRMNGQKYYIMGNHEEVLNRSKLVRDQFIWCKDIENLKISGYPNITLCHYAMRTWNGSHKGAWNLYGHSHAGLPEITKGNLREGETPFSFDIGVDAWNYSPVSIDEVREKMKKKGWS